MNTNNLKRAVFEMFGIGNMPAEEVSIIEEKKHTSESVVAHPSETSPAVPVAAPPFSLCPVSYLAADTVWEGSLCSEGDVEVLSGIFRGEINAKGCVFLHNIVESNIRAGNLQLNGCTLTGDTTTSDLTVISVDSRVKGCVTARNLRCAGTITGNIFVSDHITVEHTARISGSIVAGSISIAEGATICGDLDIKSSGN